MNEETNTKSESSILFHQRSGESTNGHDHTTPTPTPTSPTTYQSSTPFLTEAPPDYYEEPSGLIALTSNSNSEEWNEANKQLLKSQYQQNSDRTMTMDQGQGKQSGKEYRDFLRSQGSFSSFSSQSTISTKRTEYDHGHVGALLNSGKQSSYISNNTNTNDDDDDNTNNIAFDIYGNGDDGDDVSQSPTVREFDFVNSLLMRGSNTRRNNVIIDSDSDSGSDDSDDKVAAADTEGFDLMALQPLSSSLNNNNNDDDNNDSSEDEDDSEDDELSRSDVNLERTPIFIQQKEDDMLSQKYESTREENELFIGDTPIHRNSSNIVTHHASKNTMLPPPPSDDDDDDDDVGVVTFDDDDDDSNDNVDNGKKSFHPSLVKQQHINDHENQLNNNNFVALSMEDDDDDDDNDEKILFIPREEPNKDKSKFELDDDSDDDNDDDDDNSVSDRSSWKDEHSNRIKKTNTKNKKIDNNQDDNKSIKSLENIENNNIALLSVDYQMKQQPQDASLKSKLDNDDNDNDNDIEKGVIKANTDYNSDLDDVDDVDVIKNNDDNDEEVGVNVHDSVEREINHDIAEKKNNNDSKKTKIILGVMCLLIVLSSMIVGIVLGTSSSNDEEIKDPEPPNNNDQVPIMEPISILEGTSNFTNVGNIISTNNVGKTFAMVGSSITTNSSLVHIYDAILSENTITSYEVTSIIDPNSSMHILNMVLSGNGNYLIIATNEYVQAYTKSDNESTKWVTYGQQIPIETQSITNIPLSITHSGTIFAMSIPNINVLIYYYSNDEWLLRSTIQKPDTNADNFGNSISLSSNDGNRIIIGADYSNTVYVYEYDDISLQYVDIFINQPLFDLVENDNSKFGYSVSMNDNGNRIAIGSPYSNGYASNNLIESGRCNIYDIVGTAFNDTWVPIGQQLYGEISNEIFGTIISLNNNGNIIAISSPGINIVRAYQLSSSTDEHEKDDWAQLGSNFQEDGNNNNYGNSISLSLDGTILYVGSPPVVSSDSSSNSGNTYGETYAYDLNELASIEASLS